MFECKAKVMIEEYMGPLPQTGLIDEKIGGEVLWSKVCS